MKRKASKKYPVFTYAFYLILVGILVTGVTFSRYSITQSGDVSTGVAAFDCSYTIEDFSSLNFNNSDYWLTAGNDGSGGMLAAGTAHTVRVTMKNSNNGKTSDTDVQAHLRVYMSSQLADKLAIQISTENTAGTQNTYTPQIPLGELFYGTTGGTNDNGTPVLYDKYKDYGNDDTVDTANFHNYGDRSEAEDETLTVSGTLENEGTLVVSGTPFDKGGSGLKMTVTAQQRTVNYAVGFSRGVRSTPVYLDLQRDETYYAFDITLPSMLYTGGRENKSTHVVYFTLTDGIDNTAYWYNSNSKLQQRDDGSWYIITDEAEQDVVPVYDAKNVYDANDDELVKDMKTLITSPSQSYYYFKDGDDEVKITGYHFEQEATYTNENGTHSTTVRVKCEYAEGGNYNVSLYHVAPLSETSAAHYVHPIEWSGGDVLNVVYSKGSTPFKSIKTGTCNNSAGGIDIDISEITIDPINEAASITVAVNRSYYFDITALFVQASETP